MALIRRGALVTISQGSVAVGTSSTTVIAAGARSYAIVVNDSDTAIYLSIGGTAVVGEGIRINANGGAYEITELNITGAAIRAIHGGTGTKNVTYTVGART